jgi:hypothetical protein
MSKIVSYFRLWPGKATCERGVQESALYVDTEQREQVAVQLESVLRD